MIPTYSTTFLNTAAKKFLVLFSFSFLACSRHIFVFWNQLCLGIHVNRISFALFGLVLNIKMPFSSFFEASTTNQYLSTFAGEFWDRDNLCQKRKISFLDYLYTRECQKISAKVNTRNKFAVEKLMNSNPGASF
jgi:hypothetical protein